MKDTEREARIKSDGGGVNVRFGQSGGAPLDALHRVRPGVATRVAECQDDDAMWARWVLAIGLGGILLYVGVWHGLVRQDISRSSPSGPTHLRGRPAAAAGVGIAVAGLALITLGATTAMAWPIGLLSYSLWAIAGLGVAAFFLAINGRLPFAK